MTKITVTKSHINYYLNYDYIKSMDSMGLAHIVEAIYNQDIDPNYLRDLTVEKILKDAVQKSRSIDSEEEKRNWLILLPIMNHEKAMKLVRILGKEKDKLNLIEAKYENMKLGIKKKYLNKWKQMAEEKKKQEGSAGNNVHHDHTP